MCDTLLELILKTSEDTDKIAVRFGEILQAGDVVLLEGDIGAAKTHFARALIQSLQDVPEDIPSPTFTLIQTYDTQKGQIWHADLYRISNADEIEELGLVDAFGSEICLIEWPDRLGAYTPQSALLLSFSSINDGASRLLRATSQHASWAQRLAGLA